MHLFLADSDLDFNATGSCDKDCVRKDVNKEPKKNIECNARKVHFVLPLRIEVDLKETYAKDLLNNCLSSHQHQKRDSFIRDGHTYLPIGLSLF